MKDWKSLFIPIIIIFLSLGIFKIFYLIKTFRTENYKNEILNDYGTNLKACFDLKNKNKRRLYESLDLIEYCLKEYGAD